MTLSDYYAALARHDWDYAYSDDHEKYMSGSAEESRLRNAASESKRHEALWMKFWQYGTGRTKKMPRKPRTKS